MNLLLSLMLFTAPSESISEETAAKKVNAHLLIEDSYSAVSAAKIYLRNYPDSKALRLSLVRALCQTGNEIEALENWNAISLKHQDLLNDRAALETLAWGVLKKGNHSQQLLIKLYSLVGAALTRDATAIPIITEALRCSNSLLRAVSVGLASEYGDQPLRDEIVRLLKEERVWTVRLEAIKAVGKLHMDDQKEMLKEIVADPKTLAEEKAAAIVSFVGMYDAVDNRELETLIHSNRAGLRELACQIVAHLDLQDKVESILPLLSDGSPGVRLSALNAIGLLGVKQHDKVGRLLRDRAPEVAITAAWVAMISGDPRGKEQLKRWMNDSESRWRRLASAAIAVGGKEGAQLASELIEKAKDPYVEVNLAIGLIGQRKDVDKACAALDDALKSDEKTLWMWEEAYNPLFRSLGPSTVAHTPQMPDYPNAVDQMTRLELLSILCMLQYPHALEAVKGFLQNHNWGATGAAATTLVREGDEDALKVVRMLLKDRDEKVRIQAALILTLLGSDPEAIRALQEVYPNVERELKVRILETLAHVGDPETIPFLLTILNEPFQALRVIAAASIIKCLSN